MLVLWLVPTILSYGPFNHLAFTGQRLGLDTLGPRVQSKEAHPFRVTFLNFCTLVACMPHFSPSPNLSNKFYSWFYAVSISPPPHLWVLEAVFIILIYSTLYIIIYINIYTLYHIYVCVYIYLISCMCVCVFVYIYVCVYIYTLYYKYIWYVS